MKFNDLKSAHLAQGKFLKDYGYVPTVFKVESKGKVRYSIIKSDNLVKLR